MKLKHIKQFSAFFISSMLVLMIWNVLVNPISYLSVAVFPLLIGMIGLAGISVADKKSKE